MADTLTCVIAEDHRVTRNMLNDYALQAGLIVLDSVESGTALVEKVLQNPPDIIITDVGLEQLDGLAACIRLRNQGFTPEIIIVTGSMDSAHCITGIDLESTAYLVKPFVYESFMQAVIKAKKRVEMKRMIDTIQRNKTRVIRVKHKYKDIDLVEKQILFVEKFKKHQYNIHLHNGTVVETSTNLEQIKQQCSDRMFVPHRSFLANIIHIGVVIPDAIVEGNYEILYPSSTTKVPLTRRNYANYDRLASFYIN